MKNPSSFKRNENMAGAQPLWLFLFALIINESLVSSLSAAENQLASYLLNASRYSPDVRPVINYEDKLIVWHGLKLAQLIKLDEKSQIITTRVVLKIKWNDVLLKWDPAKYDGITELNVDVNLIWIPQIELFNNADDSLDTIAVPRAVVRCNGTVTALFPKILKSTCPISVQNFPFDQQICELRFGSFQFNTLQMEVKPLSGRVKFLKGIEKYEENGAWDLIDERIMQGTVYHAFSNDAQFSQLSYKILLRRKPLYYVINFLIPCVLIALITILLFLIPADTGEQMAVGVTILLSMAVFFLLLEDKMPETSEYVPLIGKYFACTIVQISLAVGAICMILCFHHHDATEVPIWMKKYILVKLARLLGIKTSENDHYAGGRRGTMLNRFRKSNKSFRRKDHFAMEIGRSHLLIWQAKAKAKRLRRERAEMEEQGIEDKGPAESSKKTLGPKEKGTESKLSDKGEKIDQKNVKAVMVPENNKKNEAKIKKIEENQKSSADQKTAAGTGDAIKNNVTRKEGKEIKENKVAKEPKKEVNDVEKQTKEGKEGKGKGDEKDVGKTGKKDVGKEKHGRKGSNAGKEKERKNSVQMSVVKLEDSEKKDSKKKLKKSVSKEKLNKEKEDKEGNEKKTVQKEDAIEKIGEKEKKVKKESKDEEGKVDKEDKSVKKNAKKEETVVKDDKKESRKVTKKQSVEEDDGKEVEDKEKTEKKNNEKKNGKRKNSNGKKKKNGEKKKTDDDKQRRKDSVIEKESEMGVKEKMQTKSEVKEKAEKKKETVKVNKKEETTAQSEGKDEEKREKLVKVGAWIKLEAEDSKKKGKNKKEEVPTKKVKKEKGSDGGNSAVKSTGQSQSEERKNNNMQNLQIDDIEDNPIDDAQSKDGKEKKDDVENELGKMEAKFKSTLAERFSNAIRDKANAGNAELGSASSIRSCDDETRILIPSPKQPALSKRNAVKQFKLVDRVVRIKESLTQKLNATKASSKDEAFEIPQPTAMQRSAKKIENATNWAEAEHESVKLMAHKIQETDSADQLRRKWKEVGKVLNNLLMWLYIASIVLAFFVFFGPVFVANDSQLQ